MKKLLFISILFIGCSEKNELPCCKTVIGIDYEVAQSGIYLGGKFWTATYLDCNNNVTTEELNQYPSSTPPQNIGDKYCD